MAYSVLLYGQDTLRNKINAKLGFKMYYLQPQFQQFSFSYLQNNNSIFAVQQEIMPLITNGANVGIEKFLNKHFFLSLNLSRTFGNTNISELSLGGGFEKNIYKKISFFGSVDLSFQRLQHKIGSFFVNDAITIQNRTYTNENIQVGLANQMLGILPKIGINMQLNDCFALYGQINYFVPITNNGYVRFSNGDFLGTKVANIDLNSNNANTILNNNSNRLTQTPFTRNIFSFEIGVKIRGKR